MVYCVGVNVRAVHVHVVALKEGHVFLVYGCGPCASRGFPECSVLCCMKLLYVCLCYVRCPCSV